MTLTGTIRTKDIFAAAQRLDRDLRAIDTNHDGVITKGDVRRNASRLKMNCMDVRMLDAIIDHGDKKRSGVDLGSALRGAFYGGAHLQAPAVFGATDDNLRPTLSAQQLAQVADPLKADYFEYVQSMEKANKKF